MIHSLLGLLRFGPTEQRAVLETGRLCRNSRMWLREPQEHPEDAPSLGSGGPRFTLPLRFALSRPFTSVFSLECHSVEPVAAEMTRRGILNVKPSLCAAAPVPAKI